MFNSTFALILVGFAAGVGSGLFGIGGGVIIVPLLIFLFGYTSQVASATSLVALLAPVGLLGVWHYYRTGFIQMEHIRMGFTMSIGLFAGALLGARIATSISSSNLQKAFSIFLVFIAIRLWVKS